MSGPKQRPFADAIARGKQPLTPTIPDRKGPHAIEVRHAVVAPHPVGLENNLGVAVGAEGAPQGFKLGAQLDVVVDLAIERDGEGAVIDDHRLGAASKVDDRQACMGEATGPVDEHTIAVGTAMMKRANGSLQNLTVGRYATELEDAHHTTHE
jgi:hypothetical protein